MPSSQFTLNVHVARISRSQSASTYRVSCFSWFGVDPATAPHRADICFTLGLGWIMPCTCMGRQCLHSLPHTPLLEAPCPLPPPSLSVSTQVLQQKLCCINPCPGLFTALAMSAQRLSWVLFKRLSATSDARSRTSQRRLPRNQTAIRRISDREHQQGPVERLSLDAVERCRMERTLIDPQR